MGHTHHSIYADFGEKINMKGHSVRSRDSSVGIPTGYQLDSRSSILGRSKRFFSVLQSPQRLWGPLSLQSNGYRGLIPTGESDRDVNLIIHLNLVLKTRIVELYSTPPYVFMAWCLTKCAQDNITLQKLY
jgi:hypothetical protein